MPHYLTSATYKATPAADQLLAMAAHDSAEDKRKHEKETESERAERIAFMNQAHHPADMFARQAGWLLGKTEREISILSCSGHLPVLGTDPADNSPKKFARDIIYRLGTEIEWLSKAKDIISDYWRFRNRRPSKFFKPNKKKKH